MFRLAPGPEGRIRVQSLNGALELFLIRLYILFRGQSEGKSNHKENTEKPRKIFFLHLYSLWLFPLLYQIFFFRRQ